VNIQALKALQLDRVLDNDEAVSLSAYARNLASEYEELGQDVPDWLVKVTDVLRTEIARRNRAADMAKLRELEQTVDSLKTAAEKRNEATNQITALQKKLGLSTTAKAGR
jgi:hypothetical protein